MPNNQHNYLNLLKWNNPSYIFGTVHYHFQGYQDGNLKLVSQQYRTWSDCTDVQAGLALYWWQRLLTFSVSRIRVNNRLQLDFSPQTSSKKKEHIIMSLFMMKPIVFQVAKNCPLQTFHYRPIHFNRYGKLFSFPTISLFFLSIKYRNQISTYLTKET